jgi:amidase
MNQLCSLSAGEAVRRLRRREVGPLDLVEAAAARIEDVEPKINALPIRFLDAARDEASRFARNGSEHRGWMAGLPIAVKDYNDVAGQLTTYGSPIYANHRAASDDRTVATLRLNGAIPLAKSNVPEFAGSHTFNPVWGVTRNPWNITRTAGGSSGGAAAALAAREIWLANGSCLGGSLRIPASFCGIVGLRPSPGLVPRGDDLPAFDTLWVEGPMARDVPDLALMLDAMALPTGHDPLSRPGPAAGFQAALNTARPPRRIGFSVDLGLQRIEPEVAEICAGAVRRLAEMGCEVELAAPDFSGAIDSFQVLRALLFADVRGALLPAERHRLNPDIAWNIEGTAPYCRRDYWRDADPPRPVPSRRPLLRGPRPPGLPYSSGAALPGGAAVPHRDRRRDADHLHRLDVPYVRHHPHRLPGHLAALRLHEGGLARGVPTGWTATWRCRPPGCGRFGGTGTWLPLASAPGLKLPSALHVAGSILTTRALPHCLPWFRIGPGAPLATVAPVKPRRS